LAASGGSKKLSTAASEGDPAVAIGGSGLGAAGAARL